MLKARRLIVLSGVVAAATGAAVAYQRLARPAFRRWGATAEEVAAPMPGDEVVADPQWAVTYAETINARPADVWPWLVQLGYGRAGFYSYDAIERRLGLDVHSVELIVPELQGLKVGDSVPFGAFELPVAMLEPERLLLLEAVDPTIGSGSWCFELTDLEDGRTRLVTRGRARFEGWDAPSAARSFAGLRQLPMIVGFEPGSYLLFRRMLVGIRERAERTAREGRTAMTAPAGWWAERMAQTGRGTVREEAEGVVEGPSAVPVESPSRDASGEIQPHG